MCLSGRPRSSCPLLPSNTMQAQIWASSIPLHLSHPSSATPYILFVPRLSYLPLLLPRLSAFYNTSISSFSHEGIQLKNLPVGLLCDLYQPDLPWRLELADGPLFDIHDTFINSVKEVRLAKMSAGLTGLLVDAICRQTSLAMAQPRVSCQCPKRTLRGCGTPYRIV